MKINSFVAKGVHKYLDFDIEFFPDLTFLIGINGSGKTSALKLILGLTSPSFHYLSQIDYFFCEVVCSSNSDERDFIIKAAQDAKTNTFSIQLTYKGVIGEPENLKRISREAIPGYENEELSIVEQRQKELFDSLETVKKIRALTTPKLLGLDRRIYEGRTIDYHFRRSRQYVLPKYRRKGIENSSEIPAIDISLEEVQLLVFDYIRRIPQQQYRISDEFKQKLFSQSFSFIEGYNVEPIPSTAKIIERKEKVLNAIDELGMKYLNHSINFFFNKIEGITKQNESLTPDEKDSQKSFSTRYLEILTRWYNNGSQLKRIDDIIRYSQEYQAKIAELRAPLKKLESIVSNFLKEGGKTLQLEADGEIKVALSNGQKANIYELSSGEKQIIIMIAHLIFEEDQGASSIFIIDEPELSLHIAWQEIFVDAITQASAKTQFILATHSPAIISKVEREKYCQDLNK